MQKYRRTIYKFKNDYPLFFRFDVLFLLILMHHLLFHHVTGITFHIFIFSFFSLLSLNMMSFLSSRNTVSVFDVISFRSHHLFFCVRLIPGCVSIYMRVSLLYGWSVCSVCVCVCARFHFPRIKFDGALPLTPQVE
jgi:hypothetical protein